MLHRCANSSQILAFPKESRKKLSRRLRATTTAIGMYAGSLATFRDLRLYGKRPRTRDYSKYPSLLLVAVSQSSAPSGLVLTSGTGEQVLQWASRTRPCLDWASAPRP